MSPLAEHSAARARQRFVSTFGYGMVMADGAMRARRVRETYHDPVWTRASFARHARAIRLAHRTREGARPIGYAEALSR